MLWFPATLCCGTVAGGLGMGWGWCAWGGWWCSWSRGLPDVVTWVTVVGGAAPPEAGPDFRTEKHAVTLAGRTKDFENQAN